MKRTLAITVASLALTVLNTHSQQGTAPSQPVPPTPPTPPATAGGQNNTITPPGQPTLPGQLPPAQAGGTNRVGAITNSSAAGTNNFASTNQFAFGVTNQVIATNRFGIFTNRFGINPLATNSGQLTPTGGTNSTLLGATNTFAFTNTVALQDQALSQSDRLLLVQIRQTVQTEMSVIAGTAITPGAWSPVHFAVRESVVTLLGFVTAPEERQQLVSVVRGVPGVTQVIDNLQIRSIDQGFSDADRALLSQVRTALRPVITVESSTPVRMVARDGMITLVGIVPTAEQGQQIETIVSAVPGVARVSNRLTVNPGFQNPRFQGGTVIQPGLQPTSRGTGQNRVFGTNAVAPSPTNTNP